MIKKISRALLLAVVMLLLVGGTVLAAFSYYADIQVQETEGEGYTYLPIIADVDNDYLSDNGYISLTGLDTRILSGSTELKHLVADDKVLFVAPTVGGDSTGNYKYTLNNTGDLGSFPVIVGHDGYITIADHLEVFGAVADDGGIQTDETTEANNDTINDMTLLPAVPAENDAYYFGYSSVFSALTINIGTQGVGVWTITWEYWDDSAWTALSDVTDNTNGFTATVGNKTVLFTLPGDWATTTVESISAYWIRARVSAYTSKTTQPLGTQSFIGEGLELGDDFEVEFDGYVDTSSGSDKNLVYKENAVRVWVSGDEEITVATVNTAGNTNYEPLANGTVNEGDLTGTTRWEAMSDDNDASCIQNNGAEEETDLFVNSNIYDDLGGFDIVNSVKVYWRAKEGQNACSGKATLYIDSTEYYGDVEAYTTLYVWYSYEWTENPSTSSAWTVDDLEDIEFGFCQWEAGGGISAVTSEVYATLNVSPEVVAIATGVSSGEHTIKAYADTTNLGIIVDEGEAGEVSDTTLLSGASVPDNANDIIINQNNVLPYFDYLKWTVSDTLIAWYQPISMIVGTTLDDREGTDAGETGMAEEDGVITWGENPVGVSATIGSLISSSQPGIAPATEGEALDIVPEGSIPSGGTVDTDALEDNPMYFLVEFMSENADLTEEQIWFGGATLIILIAMGIAVAKVPSHLLLAGTIGLVFSGFFTAMGIYQWWMLLIFSFVFIASLIMERKPVI